MGYLDVIMIMILVIIISVVIGLNIVSVVDKKLSDVQINIPPFPKSNITVNINKKNYVDYDVSVLENNDSPILENNNYPVLENNDILNNNNEHFKSDIGYKPAVFNNILIKDVEKNNNLENPDIEDVVNYDDYVCYRKDDIVDNIVSKKINHVNKKNVCKNKSINKLHQTGNIESKNYSTCNQMDWNDVDPAEFYKIFKPRPANLNDPVLNGYNIQNYASSAGIYEIGKINLDTKNKYPKPNNYSF